MFKVRYEDNVYTVVDVKIEGFEPATVSSLRPGDTWFLLEGEDYFFWAHMRYCRPVKEDY